MGARIGPIARSGGHEWLDAITMTQLTDRLGGGGIGRGGGSHSITHRTQTSTHTRAREHPPPTNTKGEKKKKSVVDDERQSVLHPSFSLPPQQDSGWTDAGVDARILGIQEKLSSSEETADCVQVSDFLIVSTLCMLCI